MEDSTQVLFTAGCVILIGWYAGRRWGRMGRRTAGSLMPKRLARGSPVWMAEFRPSAHHESLAPIGLVSCRDCGTEYPAGVLYCDCGGETVEPDDADGLPVGWDGPEESQSLPPVEDELVCIHVADTPWKATLVRNFLEQHQIPCAIEGNASVGPYAFNFGPLCEARLMVYRQDAEDAADLLQRFVANRD